MPATPDMRVKINIPPLRTKESKVCNRCLGPGQNDQIRIAGQWLSGCHKKKIN